MRLRETLLTLAAKLAGLGYQTDAGAAELQKATALIEKSANRREALEDILWALLNSNEFLFNH